MTIQPTDEISSFEVLLVSGMSGAGRSSAARALEDIGWFVIDNLPPRMLAATLELMAERADTDRVAVVVDVRGGRLFDELESAISEVVAWSNRVNVRWGRSRSTPQRSWHEGRLYRTARVLPWGTVILATRCAAIGLSGAHGGPGCAAVLPTPAARQAQLPTAIHSPHLQA